MNSGTDEVVRLARELAQAGRATPTKRIVAIRDGLAAGHVHVPVQP